MRENSESIRSFRLFGSRNIGAVTLSSVLVLGGCSGDTDADRPTETQTITVAPQPEIAIPSESSEASAAECAWSRAYVGRHYDEDNIDRIQSSMQALNGLYGIDDSFRLRDNIAEFPIMMWQSFQDPLYADALHQTVDELNHGEPIDAEHFLGLDVMQIDTDQCGDHYISKADSKQANFHFIAANNSILRALGTHVAERGSLVTQRAYEVIVKQYQELCAEIGESDACIFNDS